MQVEIARRVPRSAGIVLLGAMLLLVLASSPAQASSTPLRSVGTTVPMGTWCTQYHHKTWYAAGYTEIDVGVCYDTTTWRPTISWGPFCPSFWWYPNVRTETNNYCGWYYDSTGGITVYGGWLIQNWVPFIGWTLDHEVWEQYGV